MKTALNISLVLLMIMGFSTDGFSQRKENKTVVNKTKPASRKTSVSKTKPAPRKTPISRTKVVYNTPRKKVVSERTLPKSTVVIKHKGVSVYYDNNQFFRLNGGRYLPIAPSVGLQIRTLPIGYKKLTHNNRNFYIHNGIYFVKVNEIYEVVNPEIGTIIYELPSDAEKVTIEGAYYYEFNDILYEKVQVDGTRAYEVVGYIGD